MASTEDEPVSIGPPRVVGVVAHDAGPEHMSQGRHCHGRSLMPRAGLMGRVHSQTADDADALGFESSRKLSHGSIDPFRWSWEQHHRGGEPMEEIAAANRAEFAGAEHPRHRRSLQCLVDDGGVVVGPLEQMSTPAVAGEHQG